MKFSFLLDPSQYTLKNALFWGLAHAHLSEIRPETEWRGRVVHLVIGLAEMLPIVGQIVSFRKKNAAY